MHSIIFIENRKTHSPKKLKKIIFLCQQEERNANTFFDKYQASAVLAFPQFVFDWQQRQGRIKSDRISSITQYKYTNTNLYLAFMTGKSDRISFIYLNCTAHFLKVSLSDCRQDKRWNKIVTWWFRRFVFLLYFCKFFHFLFGLTVVWSIGLQCSD